MRPFKYIGNQFIHIRRHLLGIKDHESESNLRKPARKNYLGITNHKMITSNLNWQLLGG